MNIFGELASGLGILVLSFRLDVHDDQKQRLGMAIGSFYHNLLGLVAAYVAIA